MLNTSGHFEFPLEKISEVHVYPLPWVEQCYCRGVLDAETREASMDHLFDIPVNAVPPHIAPCQRHHPRHSKVSTVKFEKNRSLQLSRNDHSSTPEKAISFNGELIMPVLVQFQLLGSWAGPTTLGIL